MGDRMSLEKIEPEKREEVKGWSDEKLLKKYKDNLSTPAGLAAIANNIYLSILEAEMDERGIEY